MKYTMEHSIEDFKRSMSRVFDPLPPPPIVHTYRQAGAGEKTLKDKSGSSKMDLLSPEEKANITQQKVVLVVDDAAEYLQACKNILEYRYGLFLAKSGEDALNVLQKHLVDIILLDIEMPEMSGFQLFDVLKCNPAYCTIPVIFVTSHAQSDIITKAIELGAKGYIVKPFKEMDLIAKITQTLSASPGKMAVIDLSRQLIDIEKNLIKIQKLLEDDKDPINAYEKILNLQQETFWAFSKILRENNYNSFIKMRLTRIYSLIKNEDAQAFSRLKEFIDDLGVRDLVAGFTEQ
ncbi:MAG: response regulator [Treponema sp.]|jgi:CheY-like chemotaxis protein|nr:response regulator [Treponema sp.]